MICAKSFGPKARDWWPWPSWFSANLTRDLVAKHPAVTIDGCKQMCAAKMVKQSGGTVTREVAVLDVFRRHKDLKPEGIAELNEAGRRLARVLAEEVAESLDGTGQSVKGASHV